MALRYPFLRPIARGCRDGDTKSLQAASDQVKRRTSDINQHSLCPNRVCKSTVSNMPKAEFSSILVPGSSAVQLVEIHRSDEPDLGQFECGFAHILIGHKMKRVVE